MVFKDAKIVKQAGLLNRDLRVYCILLFFSEIIENIKESQLLILAQKPAKIAQLYCALCLPLAMLVGLSQLMLKAL